jgi:hypothetical protein
VTRALPDASITLTPSDVPAPPRDTSRNERRPPAQRRWGMAIWHHLTCRLGWHQPTTLHISHGWRHQICRHCQTDLCRPVDGAR